VSEGIRTRWGGGDAHTSELPNDQADISKMDSEVADTDLVLASHRQAAASLQVPCFVGL
jgi:hypothetical protein